MKWANDDIYKGEWFQNKKNGRGLDFYLDGSRYKGEFLGGLPHGNGELRWKDDSYYKG